PDSARVAVHAPDVQVLARVPIQRTGRDEIQGPAIGRKEWIGLDAVAGERRWLGIGPTGRRATADEDAPALERGGAAHEVELARARIERRVRLEEWARDPRRLPGPDLRLEERRDHDGESHRRDPRP